MAEKHPKVLMKTNKGDLLIELYPEYAPGTVDNFLKLVRKGFYDNLLYHRVIDKFVVQGGCPLTRDPSKKRLWGTGGPGYTIKDEVDPKRNPLKHDVGMISMAKSAAPDSGGSQFFIVLSRENTKHLDGVHTVFGKVIEGTDNIFKIKQEDKMIKVSVIDE